MKLILVQDDSIIQDNLMDSTLNLPKISEIPEISEFVTLFTGNF